MNDEQLKEFIEILYPFIKQKIIKDGTFKKFVQRKNATVVSVLETNTSNIGSYIDVVLPYDTTSFSVRNETGIDLNKDDLVCIEYCIDLKNAVAVYKVN